jgi:hypothetical protein
MKTIVDYCSHRAPSNDYPRRIVSPERPSACCGDGMERIGQAGLDGKWRFYYKRCRECGYTVRCIYAQSLLASLGAAPDAQVIPFNRFPRRARPAGASRRTPGRKHRGLIRAFGEEEPESALVIPLRRLLGGRGAGLEMCRYRPGDEPGEVA